jgi:tetratricopeptide (TPR) repeat protein
VVLETLTPASPQRPAKPRSSPSSASSAPALSNTAEAVRRNNLGAAYMGQQRFAEATRLFQSAHELDPKLEVARLNEAISLLNEQKIEPAKAALLAVIKRDAANARAWYNLGLLYKGVGQAKEAVDAFRHAARLAPTDANAQYFLGASAAQVQDDKDAIAAFEEALHLNPYHASAEFGLARVYQHLGNQEDARKHLVNFQRLTQSKLGVPMSLAYGEQGPLSLAEQTRTAQTTVEPAAKVTFKDVTQTSGLQGNKPSEKLITSGIGACWLDFDNDGNPDLFIGAGGQAGGMALFHNLGHGRFEDVTKGAGLDASHVAEGCAVSDYDNDGFRDLAISLGKEGRVVLYHNEHDGTFKDVTTAAHIRAAGRTAHLVWVDYDHDGDTDLYVVGSLYVSGRSPSLLFRNNGNGTFTDVTEETGFGNGAHVALATDFNNDRAIDLVTVGAKPSLLTNPREGKWPRSEPWDESETVAAAIADFNKDGWMDVAFARAAAPAVTLWRNVEGRSAKSEPLPDLGLARANAIVALDYDNDGWMDLAVVGTDQAGKGAIRLLRNEGPSGFRDVTADTGLNSIALTTPEGIAAADYDGDGHVDLIIVQADAPPVLLRNGGTQNHSLRLALKGLNDNKSAIGTKVEVFAGDLWQKFEIGNDSSPGQSSKELVVGLGKRQQADVVRILWPTGVVQDEIEIAAGKPTKIVEMDRRGSSCPVLFAWDGARYRFVTDMLGAGVLGHWVAPVTRNIPDPTEYVKIEDFAPALRNGRLSFRLMEPMEEVVYIDQVRLLAVDHPANAAVYPNEYFASNPPYPEFMVITARQPRTVRAWDDSGREVSDLLSKRDDRYVSDFTRLPFAGFTREHKLELDLGQTYSGGPLRLLMTGYIEYFTATSMYAADQAGVQPFAPYVEALVPDGQWVRVLDDMGFPAGLPRTITVDLSGKLPKGTTRIRLTTNLQIYWDQVLVDDSVQLPVVSSEEHTGVVVREVPLAQAKLGFHGYPKAVEGGTPGDLSYRYEVTSATGPYSREIGAYTRPGDVTPLLESVDDKFTIFGSGEELALDFDPATLPKVAPGWKRDYFFFAQGYEKDMDFYAADANTVGPLPFHDMSTYPSSRTYPTDAAHTRYQLEFNTHFISNPAPRSFRFAYPKPRNGQQMQH